MQIGIIGINHKLANVDLRDSFAKACEKKFHPSSSNHQGHSLIRLSTCNRTEIYFTSLDLAETHSYILNILKQEISAVDFDQKLYSYFGYECFNHLSRVTSGLDSACIAETEIQGQVKTAYEAALNWLRLPYDLHYLFQKSLAIGKQIRSTLNLGRGLPDLRDAVLDAGCDFFGSLDNIKILFVGASSINEKIASHKKFAGCHLMTRSEERGRELEQKLPLISIPWDLSAWTNYDWVIFGAKGSDFLIGPSSQLSLPSKKLLIDLSVPRNVDPALEDHPLITLLNIDQINRHLSIRQKELKASLKQADSLIATLTERHLELWHQKINAKLKIVALSA